VTMDELLMLFKGEQATRRPCPHPVFSSGIATLALLQDGMRTRRFLFCSPRDNYPAVWIPMPVLTFCRGQVIL
jgi:hypothetical protein